jgi:hypothetical protein
MVKKMKLFRFKARAEMNSKENLRKRIELESLIQMLSI